MLIHGVRAFQAERAFIYLHHIVEFKGEKKEMKREFHIDSYSLIFHIFLLIPLILRETINLRCSAAENQYKI